LTQLINHGTHHQTPQNMMHKVATMVAIDVNNKNEHNSNESQTSS